MSSSDESDDAFESADEDIDQTFDPKANTSVVPKDRLPGQWLHQNWYLFHSLLVFNL